MKVPKGPPPKKLVIKDLKKGTGAEATDGSTVSVQYVGVLYDGGKQFDASWDRGQPFSFPLGAGQVIPGWDQGVKGMKVGGRRELIIPPDLGYGAQGAGADIPPNAALIFVVDLLDVQQ
ncbi:FKBP-type peptidyl-prolyl cis-trans isomerase [Candidatus Solirubrobacter pratensis]|uniref:FKBP-type peptidyl-prolyl cis-trans isomerase n=1 Tax=Candidatus Solirubrobacter pratensis TaxID=1298857 RepID=UPI00048491BA